MRQTTIRELKRGEFFTLKPIEEPNENRVYVRGEYERSSKKYSCSKYSDWNHETFKKGNTIVYTDFTF